MAKDERPKLTSAGFSLEVCIMISYDIKKICVEKTFIHNLNIINVFLNIERDNRFVRCYKSDLDERSKQRGNG